MKAAARVPALEGRIATGRASALETAGSAKGVMVFECRKSHSASGYPGSPETHATQLLRVSGAVAIIDASMRRAATDDEAAGSWSGASKATAPEICKTAAAIQGSQDYRSGAAAQAVSPGRGDSCSVSHDHRETQ